MVTGGASASGATSLDSTEIHRGLGLLTRWELITGRLPTLMRRFGLVTLNNRVFLFGIIKSKYT